jgi:hypothetical protein
MLKKKKCLCFCIGKDWCSQRAHTYLISDDLPELGTNLVATLAALDVHDLTHFEEADQDGATNKEKYSDDIKFTLDPAWTKK